MDYTLYNVNNSYLYLEVDDGYDTMGCNLYKDSIQFFVRLKNNLHNKNYKDRGSNEGLSYADETLVFKFVLVYGYNIYNIRDKDFIKQICEDIISEAIKLNILKIVN